MKRACSKRRQDRREAGKEYRWKRSKQRRTTEMARER